MKKLDSYFLLICSLAIVAFNQEGFLGYLAAFLGYALFFHSLSYYSESKKKCFLIATFWFFSVQVFQLSWMTSTIYMSSYFLIVYFLLALGLGLEFGLLSLFFPKNKKFGMSNILTICAFWTILEWSRLFFLSGFTWNPIGLALTNNHFSLQFASVLGIYGLSFWVMGVNLIGLKAFYSRKAKYLGLWIIFFLLPYFFGFVHEQIQSKNFKGNQSLSVVLVQTSLYPEEKELMPDNEKAFVSPYIQWQRILEFLKEKNDKKIDLIVLPEASLPFGAYNKIYSYDEFLQTWKNVFDKLNWDFLPALKNPLASQDEYQGKDFWKICNAYWALAIANYFNAEVIIGLDDRDSDYRSYNSAFYFLPNNYEIKRYEKQILLPLVEYFPFPFCSKIAARFGINGVFTPGKEAKVFYGKVPLSISICYEETFGNLIKNARKKGASLLVNITNDGYFPSSKLPKKHFELGKIRSVENGVPIIRACNTGITGAVDCFGRVIKIYGDENFEKIGGALHIEVPLNSYKTVYALCGDGLIIGLCFFILGINGYRKREDLKFFMKNFKK
jgi:apolipoprotein N-acyltransferase